MIERSRSENDRNDLEESRRNFMKAAGKLAAYTPPAMVLLMQPTPDAIAASPNGNDRGDLPTDF